jgi:hypothetical protein
MRLIVKTYADNTRSILETSDDGSSVVGYLDHSKDAALEASKMGKRISVYMEVICDNNETGADRLLSNLDFLKTEAEKRKALFAKKARKKKHA